MEMLALVSLLMALALVLVSIGASRVVRRDRANVLSALEESRSILREITEVLEGGVIAPTERRVQIFDAGKTYNLIIDEIIASPRDKHLREELIEGWLPQGGLKKFKGKAGSPLVISGKTRGFGMKLDDPSSLYLDDGNSTLQ